MQSGDEEPALLQSYCPKHLLQQPQTWVRCVLLVRQDRHWSWPCKVSCKWMTRNPIMLRTGRRWYQLAPILQELFLHLILSRRCAQSRHLGLPAPAPSLLDEIDSTEEQSTAVDTSKWTLKMAVERGRCWACHSVHDGKVKACHPTSDGLTSAVDDASRCRYGDAAEHFGCSTGRN